MIIPVESPSPMSATPANASGFSGAIADAMASIVSKTGNNVFEPWNIRIWNDACKSAAVGTPYLAVAIPNPAYISATATPGVPATLPIGAPNPAFVPAKGSGRWQFIIEQEFFPAGAQIPLIYQARCQGNATISVGGFRAAPCPLYPQTAGAVDLIYGPLFPFPSLPAMTSPGNTSIMRPKVLSSAEQYMPWNAGPYSQILAQLHAMALDEAGPSGTLGTMFYYFDPQTKVDLTAPLATGGFQGYGTNEWKVSLKAWTTGASALSVLNIGGCATQMLGGHMPIQPPVAWAYGGYSQQVSVYTTNYYLYTATQLFNDFSF